MLTPDFDNKRNFSGCLARLVGLGTYMDTSPTKCQQSNFCVLDVGATTKSFSKGFKIDTRFTRRVGLMGFPLLILLELKIQIRKI